MNDAPSSPPNAAGPAKPRLVKCPRCGGDSIYAASNPFRPFCSERCKDVDFGAWATEGYRMNATPPKEGDGDMDLPGSGGEH
jgi:endogenous inhibitor of DNA gyrase (YacG/DUF329 family)